MHLNVHKAFFMKATICPVSWVPEVRPSSGKGAPEKRSPGTAIPPGWQASCRAQQALLSLDDQAARVCET